MIPSYRFLLCGALLVGFACTHRVAAQETAPQSAANSPVKIYVTASAKDGSATALATSDLLTFIDKQQTQVTSLRPAKEDKLLFALLIDGSTSERKYGDSIKKAAAEIFEKLSSGGNRGYLGVFDVVPTVSKQPITISQAQHAIDQIMFGGGTALYDSIAYISTRVLSRAKNPDFRRRVLVVFSDGDDNQSKTATFEAEDAAMAEGIAIFTVSLDSGNMRGSGFLKEASSRTGGRAITGTSFENGVAPLLAAIDGQWELSIVPNKPADQKWHSLKVEAGHGISVFAPAKVFLP
jgi:hypothetical protein